MVISYIGIGSNLGNRKKNIFDGVALLSSVKGIRIESVSPLYETQPVGGPKQGNFINGVIKAATTLKPHQLLDKLQWIEKKLRRVRKKKWGPRTIDLDILTYGKGRFSSKKLKIPHPAYHERRFVLKPFADISPGFVHPVLGVQNQTLLRQLTPLGQRVTIIHQWKKSPYSQSKKRKNQKHP